MEMRDRWKLTADCGHAMSGGLIAIANVGLRTFIRASPVALQLLSLADSPPRFTVIDESADWLVVDKPPFLGSAPEQAQWPRHALWHGLRGLLAYELVNGGQVSIINRLDRETSGLTLVAKHRDAARDFCRQMEARHVEKEYLALVWGWPASGRLSRRRADPAPGRAGPSPIYLKQMVHPDGRRALARVSRGAALHRSRRRMATASRSSAPSRRPAACTRSACILRTPASRRRRQNLRAGRRLLSGVHPHRLDARAGLPAAASRGTRLHSTVAAAAGRRAGLAIAPRPGSCRGWAGENLLAASAEIASYKSPVCHVSGNARTFPVACSPTAARKPRSKMTSHLSARNAANR